LHGRGHQAEAGCRPCHGNFEHLERQAEVIGREFGVAEGLAVMNGEPVSGFEPGKATAIRPHAAKEQVSVEDPAAGVIGQFLANFPERLGVPGKPLHREGLARGRGGASTFVTLARGAAVAGGLGAGALAGLAAAALKAGKPMAGGLVPVMALAAWAVSLAGVAGRHLVKAAAE
jgi:hypothetical protein